VPNLFSPPTKEEKPKVPSNESPPNKHNIPPSYLNNFAPPKPNYHYKNNPSPEPFKGPRIVEVSKDQNPEPKNAVKDIQDQVKNIGDKVNNLLRNDANNKYIPSQIPSREQQRPSNEPQKVRGNKPQVNGNPFDPIVKQQNQQNQINRAEAVKKLDREIIGGGGGMAFNFVPSSNKNANAKKDNLFIANSKKKPVVTPVNQTPKRAEQEKREKELAQQKLAEMKKKAEEEKLRKEKRAMEEAERKQVIQNQRMEREKEREEARKKIREDRERLRV